MSCKINTCCGCVELRTGCLILSYVNLVWTTVLLALCLVSLLGSANVMLVINFTSVLLNLIFIVLLLVGLHKNQQRAVLAYLVFCIIFAAFNLIMLIIKLVYGFALRYYIMNPIDLCLAIIIVIVIRSYYLLMNKGSYAAARQ